MISCALNRAAAERRDADAALQVKQLPLLDVLQAAHELEHVAGDELRLAARHVAQQHDELVAAEARDEIVGPHGVAELLRSELQQMIAGSVTARVVDVLELIEVDEEQRGARVARLRQR